MSVLHLHVLYIYKIHFIRNTCSFRQLSIQPIMWQLHNAKSHAVSGQDLELMFTSIRKEKQCDFSHFNCGMAFWHTLSRLSLPLTQQWLATLPWTLQVLPSLQRTFRALSVRLLGSFLSPWPRLDANGCQFSQLANIRKITLSLLKLF